MPSYKTSGEMKHPNHSCFMGSASVMLHLQSPQKVLGTPSESLMKSGVCF